MDWGIGGFKGGEGGEGLIKMLEIGQKRQFSPFRGVYFVGGEG